MFFPLLPTLPKTPFPLPSHFSPLSKPSSFYFLTFFLFRLFCHLYLNSLRISSFLILRRFILRRIYPFLLLYSSPSSHAHLFLFICVFYLFPVLFILSFLIETVFCLQFNITCWTQSLHHLIFLIYRSSFVIMHVIISTK